MKLKIAAADAGSEWSSKMTQFLEMLLEVKENPRKFIGTAIYPAAGLVADEIRSGIENLPSLRKVKEKDNKLWGVSRRQRKGLLEGLGISTIEVQRGFHNVKIGFDGYNEFVTQKWPNGQPNALIANTIEHGTSFMNKKPFIRPAVRRVREQAVKEMEKSLDHSFAEIQKKYERRR